MRSSHASRRLTLCWLAAVLTPVAIWSQPPVVRVGPDILVSRTPDIPQAELRIAAHPTDPKRLIGTAITFRSTGDLSTIIEAYLSQDGGNTWTARIPPHQARYGGGDPHAGYTNRGTALALSISRAPQGGIQVYRSEDDGATWDNRRAAHGDWEQLTVDRSMGPYSGRIYLTAELAEANDKRAVGVWRSSDDGRSWIGPVIIPSTNAGGLNVVAIDVLSDGMVAVWISNYTMQDTTITKWPMLISTSSDGGVTFSPTRQIGTYNVPGGWLAHRRRIGSKRVEYATGYVDGAVDSRGTQFRDRMYTVWVEQPDDRARGRIFTAYSNDRGRTWSRPKPIVPEVRDAVSQAKPIIAVNRDGAVGVMWLDNSETDPESWNVYFSASIDGGETWSRPARLSTAASTPFGSGNVRPLVTPSAANARAVSASLYPAFRWTRGGDYLGMAASADGVFHPFWADARTGTYQVHTSRVEVSKAPPVLPGPAELEQRTVNASVTFVVDPVSVDWDRGEVLIPIRLRNVSSDTLFGPITVRVKTLIDTATVLLNASNGPSRAPGAELDYSSALRDIKLLPPGGVTGAIVWRLKPRTLRTTTGGLSADVLASMRKPR